MNSLVFPVQDTSAPSRTDDGFISVSSVRPTPSRPPLSGGNGPPTPDTNRGTSTQMYLFTFLATVCLLSIVAIGLLWRAIHVRRRFHRQVVEAMARGEPPPNFRSPFISRYPPGPKKVAELGPMPLMWENEIRRTDWDVEKGGKGEDGWVEDTWQDVVPMAIVSVPDPEPEPHSATRTPPPVEIPQLSTVTAELRDTFRDMIPRRSRDPPRVRDPSTETPVTMQKPIVGEVPDPGTALRVGVVIAMPCEAGARWTPVDPEEADVPEVMLGVMECVVSDKSPNPA
ncbi:hypothetical protein CcaverHIS002_0308550 [Cutaneotrichosporon cavernicola]|uniref:Uncharacterized protein n=1 Tax=Cutaneotrichosporon cavernicola TaxID=279322 RepID=A0AA48L152_9TREE|nr:uncharacterized protein CcaverHIS019_0308410 [Cutaneotrichosporon cavernicola]BEI82987.1 hypothetical protein CcaverHIS002_0308550 [Cutaneotrichosporon cavernicola]BEI90771.1 hypothetical protein CcaverHIS019_0308410 [Cutaneotrichosporon cavernicola]BEI98551.1 hypothetical protein CcaverHIS631_0308500 [Cutaneotrichosporon cavernicola]BEJ06322.1 hypothetical protein CcaverHIS641_0308440 [Cutaneotrichosporon cavernicola]